MGFLLSQNILMCLGKSNPFRFHLQSVTMANPTSSDEPARLISIPEKLFNILFGLSAISWAVLGIMNASVDERFTPVRISIAAINLCVGILFLIREPLKKSCTPSAIFVSLPSLVIAGIVLKLAAPIHHWSLPLEILFVTGTVIAILSFITLGGSFALFPAVRTIVSGGPFRIIRHPAYAGEFLMVLSCALSQPTLIAAWPAMAIVPFIIVRILAEESVLKTDSDYQSYSKKVTWRLLPKVW